MTMNRKKFLVFCLLTIMARTVLMACSSSAKSPRLASKAVILAFGVSLTQAYFFQREKMQEYEYCGSTAKS